MLFLFAPPALEAPQPSVIPARITLDEALRIFRSRGLDLLLAEGAVAQAQGDLRIAGALPGPQLGLSAGKTEGYVPQLPGQSARSYGASLSDGGSLDDLLAGRRSLRVRLAEAALRAARLGREDALRTVGALVKTQFVQTALAKLNVDLSTETRDSARHTLELVQKRASAGAVSDVEVSRAEVAYLETEQALESSRQTREAARANLAFLLGERGAVPSFETVGAFDHPQMPAELATATPESLLAAAKVQRPDLAAAKAQEEKFDAALSLARREWVPATGWSLGVAQEGTGPNALQPRTWTLGLSINLPSPRKVQGDTARARADRSVQELTRRKAEAQTALDVASNWASFQGGRARLTRMEGRLLEQAKKAYDLVVFQYERGAASLMDVLDAQRTWIATRNEYQQNLNDYWTGVFGLEQAVGKELSR
jgi:cobalt-zinc-cadmium efflux system outer membrane protein